MQPESLDQSLSLRSKESAFLLHGTGGCVKPLRADPLVCSLLEWGRMYLPAHFRLPPSRMHRGLASWLDMLHELRGTKLNVIGPRGGAKSTLVTLAYVLRCAVEAREPYIWIVSDTRPQALLHLQNVREELIHNGALRTAYESAATMQRGGRERIRLAGSTIEAFSTGQRIRGRRMNAHRPTLIVCDDVQNDRHMESPRARELSQRWFHGTLAKAGTKRTNIINLATALHRDALALELARTPGWIAETYRAIAAWPQHMELWNEWEAIYSDVADPTCRDRAQRFYDEHRTAMHLGAELLWPEEEDLYTLMKMRAEGGHSAFEREKQGSPLHPELCEWPAEYFGDHLWFEEWPRQLQVKVLALDPSKGSDARRGDYSALVVVGIDMAGLMFVEADLARRPTPQIVADGVELVRRFRPHAFGIETNQFQELLADEISSEFNRQGVLGIAPWTINNHVSKVVRIRRLGPFLASKRVRFKSDSPGTRMLVEQLRDFPNSNHDDGPDALEMAIRLANGLLEGEGGGVS